MLCLAPRSDPLLVTHHLDKFHSAIMACSAVKFHFKTGKIHNIHNAKTEVYTQFEHLYNAKIHSGMKRNFSILNFCRVTEVV